MVALLVVVPVAAVLYFSRNLLVITKNKLGNRKLIKNLPK